MRHVFTWGSSLSRAPSEGHFKMSKHRPWHVPLTGALALIAASGVSEALARNPNPTTPEYRSLDGSGNNRSHWSWGRAGANYLREASGAHYADGRSSPAGVTRPGAREISNAVASQGDVATEDSRGLSTCIYEFGQFLDHDIGLARGGSVEAFNIPVPMGDPYFDPNSTGRMTIPLNRSAFDPATGVTSARQQVNTVSSFIDASQVYGSNPVRAAWLRSGVGGQLKVMHAEYGDMLPYNDGTLENDNPLGYPPTCAVRGWRRPRQRAGRPDGAALRVPAGAQLAGESAAGAAPELER